MYNINLQVGLHKAKLYPLKYDRIPLESCDVEGKVVIGQRDYNKTKYFYPIKKDGKVIAGKKEYEGQTFKLVNEQPRAKFKRTKEINPQDIIYVDEKYAHDLITETLYFVDSPTLLKEIDEEHFKQALYIRLFTFGNGYKYYQGFIYFDDNFGCLICRMGLGSIKKKIAEIKGDVVSIKQQEKIMDDEGVPRVSENDMLEMVVGDTSPIPQQLDVEVEE